jgi:hypothetical protein
MMPDEVAPDSSASAASEARTIVLEGRQLGLVVVAVVGLHVLAFLLGVLLGRGAASWRSAPAADPYRVRPGDSWVRIGDERPGMLPARRHDDDAAGPPRGGADAR